MMPSIEDNITVWGKTYDWRHHGDEWSQPWGGTDSYGMEQYSLELFHLFHRYNFGDCAWIWEMSPIFAHLV